MEEKDATTGAKKIGIKEFLTLYTTIPEKFIDDYCYFRQQSDKNLFGIDLQEVIDYLEIANPTRFRSYFRVRFSENINYIIIIPEKRGTQQARRKYYFINFNTFRCLCMLSKTPKGREFKNVFNLLDDLIDRCKNCLSDGIDKEEVKNLVLDPKYVSLIKRQAN